jgi:hypothetical protein
MGNWPNKFLALAVSAHFALGICPAADEPGGPYRINLSSTVERAYTRFSKEPYHEHGKRYVIISLTPWGVRRKRPVNQQMLLAELRRALALHGFHEPEAGGKPDIVLTVLYGRGLLVNPFTKDSIEIDPYGASGPSYWVSEWEARTMAMPGGYGKIIAAGAPKLFIAISAWQYPTSATEKPKLVWRTIVNTDDPDEDLSLQSEKLLLAAAQFFDHPIDEPEITISSNLPEGWVKIGTPTVIVPNQPGK